MEISKHECERRDRYFAYSKEVKVLLRSDSRCLSKHGEDTVTPGDTGERTATQ